MADRKHQFTCYPSATEGNPLLLECMPGMKSDPLVVELHTSDRAHLYARVYRNGILIAHSAVVFKDDEEEDKYE